MRKQKTPPVRLHRGMTDEELKAAILCNDRLEIPPGDMGVVYDRVRRMMLETEWPDNDRLAWFCMQAVAEWEKIIPTHHPYDQNTENRWRNKP